MSGKCVNLELADGPHGAQFVCHVGPEIYAVHVVVIYPSSRVE